MRILLVLTAVLLLGSTAPAQQTPLLGIYADHAGTNCDLSSEPGIVTYHVVLTNTQGATGVEFAAPLPACYSGSWIADTEQFPVTIGNSQTGVSIGLGACLGGGPVCVLEIQVFSFGAAGSCCPWPVLPHPNAISGSITVADCSGGVIASDALLSFANGDVLECPCSIIEDCNTNGIPDVLDIADGTSSDCDLNGVPDDCTPSLYLDPQIADGGFETQSPGALSSTFGEWGHDLSATVTGELGISPPEGTKMLKFLGTETGMHSQSGNSDIQQFVSLCEVPDVNTGNVGAFVSAKFNRVAGDAETDREFQLILQAYAGAVADFDGNGALAQSFATLDSDDDPSTWEQVGTSLTIPANADYLTVWLRAVEDVFDDATDPEFDGHYVDDVVLTTGVGSACEVLPPSIDFGTVSEPTDASFTIVNRGAFPISGSVSSPCLDFAIVSGGGPFTLLKDESQVVGVRYYPHTTGRHYCPIELPASVCGPIAYVADNSAGMDLLDISDPTSPQLIANWPGVSYAPALKDGHAIVAHGGKWVRFVNVEVPTNPYQVNSRDIGCCTRDVMVVGDNAYVARSGTLSGLQIFGVANPASPNTLGTYSSADDAWKVDVQGDHAYLASSTAGLEILDVSDPNNPWREGQYTSGSTIYGVDVVGDIAYLAAASDGLEIVNVADPMNPYHVGDYFTGSSANDLVVRHGIAYLVSSVSAGPAALTIMDVSDPANPALLASLPGPASLYSIELFAGHAYIAATSAGLWVVDISDPSNPVTAATYDTAGSATGLAIGGGIELTGFASALTATPKELSSSFAVSGATPNPFGRETAISFSLDQSKRVEVVVYDVAGRRVRTITNRSYPAGRHFVQWNGKDDTGSSVAQGVYLVQLSDGSRKLTRKVIQVR